MLHFIMLICVYRIIRSYNIVTFMRLEYHERYDDRVRQLIPRSHLIKKFMIWLTVDIICFVLEMPLIYLGKWLC